MARPSKAKSPRFAKFAVFEDGDSSSSIPVADPSDKHDHDHMESASDSGLELSEYAEEGESEPSLEDISEDITPSNTLDGQTDLDIDNRGDLEDRRESTLTRRTSISSLPESSVFDTEYESQMRPMHKPYTPPSTRPMFRRPESVRRMQLAASPTPRRSVRRSRTSTPRSVKQSQRPRALQYQGEEDTDDEKKEYPLVLLHVTLLPVELRWSASSMLAALPPNVIENLQLLRSKVSETILHRGILIPHPREEYELLEERLLEALELRKERVTKCGHFRTRDSTSSLSSGEGSVESADSGVGSSLDGDDVERCTTCASPVKGIATAISVVGRKWSIKVFAANGLMRASAWTAAWSEMERVDVEILPWISEDLRKQLDTMTEREEYDERQRREEDEAHIKEVVEEQVRIAHEEKMRENEEQRTRNAQNFPEERRSFLEMQQRPLDMRSAARRRSELPKVYRAADIPMSVLLRNYLFLLAQDKRNVAMLLLGMLAFWSFQVTATQPSTWEFTPLPAACENVSPEMMHLRVNNASSGLDPSEEIIARVSAVVEQAQDLTPEELMRPEVGTVAIVGTTARKEDLPVLVTTKPLMESISQHLPSVATKDTFDKNVTSDEGNICVNQSTASEIFTSAAFCET